MVGVNEIGESDEVRVRTDWMFYKYMERRQRGDASLQNSLSLRVLVYELGR